MMSDTDKLVAAILAGARCMALNAHADHTTYIVEYETFLHLLEERDQAAEEAQAKANLKTWENLGGP